MFKGPASADLPPTTTDLSEMSPQLTSLIPQAIIPSNSSISNGMSFDSMEIKTKLIVCFYNIQWKGNVSLKVALFFDEKHVRPFQLKTIALA